MKKKFIIVFVGIILFFTSWNLTNVKFDDPNKDKLLIEIIKYVLDKGHYQSKEINDEFSCCCCCWFNTIFAFKNLC